MTRVILATCGDYKCYYYFVLIDGRVCCCKDLRTGKNTNKQTCDSDKSNETSSRKDGNKNVKLHFVKLFDDTSNNSTSNNSTTSNGTSNKNYDDRVMTLQTSGNSAIAITQNGFVYV